VGSLLARIIDEGLITPAYQPLVDLYSGEVLGYEALARGPKGELERPDLLFAAARREGRLADLDSTCRRAAVATAYAAGLRAPSTLFVNVEPEAIGQGGHRDAADLPGDMRVVAEITERALTSRPSDLLYMVERVREMGIGIALDDVGADRRSLALMPFLRPDVVKLDLRLVQDRPSKQVAEVHNAVSAHAERTGALVVAEGIETEEHLERARAMGASVGQGWLFGRPGPLPDSTGCTARPVPIFEMAAGEAADTPFGMIDGNRPQRRGTKRLLLEISRELERQAELLGDSAVLISTFQHARHFTPLQAELYGALSRQVAFIGALGQDMSGAPAPGVRGANLTSDDPLAAEWDIVVVSPHFAAAFTARDMGDSGSDMERRFDFQLTHDRDLAVRAARILMARIEPLPVDAPASALSVAA
jgi:EAL domain-containing protein (putative c-di-GMP-specific phosphodiesterase class I)